MYQFTARSLNEATLGLLRDLLASAPVNSRYGKTLELHNASVLVTNPKDRYLTLDERKNNLFHTVAETLWVLAGDNRVNVLEPFLPRAKEFSDDGLVWRAGYGPRVSKQIEYCYNILKKDPESRRAFMIVPIAEEDHKDSKDIPCTLAIHWLVRDGHLHATVTMRSNDVLWGFSSINMFEWTFLQELMAGWLGLKVGTYCHFATSLHLYAHHFDRANCVVDSPANSVYSAKEYFYGWKDFVSTASPSSMRSECRAFVSKVEEYLATGKVNPILTFGSSTIGYYANFALAYLALKQNTVDSLALASDMLATIPKEFLLYRHLNDQINLSLKKLPIAESKSTETKKEN